MGDAAHSIWMRPERADRRGPRPAHSRDEIARVAIRIADAEGLEAASMRRIGAELGTSAMTLYRYVPSRNDLIELMTDAVVGDMNLPAEPTGDRRADLELLAHELRAHWRRHPWLITLVRGRPVLGPNSLRMTEFMHGTLARPGLPIDEVTGLAGLFTSYVFGFVRNEVGWDEEARRTGVTREQWMTEVGPYVRQLVDSGRYPMFARVIRETDAEFHTADARFEAGLRRVLNSIGVRAR
jgi:AcrR family transcriptional regulator